MSGSEPKTEPLSLAKVQSSSPIKSNGDSDKVVGEVENPLDTQIVEASISRLEAPNEDQSQECPPNDSAMKTKPDPAEESIAVYTKVDVSSEASSPPVYDPPWVRYLQFFSEEDDGVPPGCWWPFCPLNHSNWLFNHSPIALQFSKFGLVHFERNRKLYLGLASLFTMVTFFITFWGCLALSTKRDLVQRTYWYAGTGHNSTDGSDFTIYVGLRSLEQVNCKFVAGYDNYHKECERHSIKWAEAACHDGLSGPACETCASSAAAMWFTAFANCASLVLAWLGAQTRMRVLADCPAQKIVGMCSDTLGVASLAAALFRFHSSCYNPLDNAYNKEVGVSTHFWLGPGFLCYMVCCLCGIIRSLAHWLTPVPGKGKHSVFALLLPCYFVEDSAANGHLHFKYSSASVGPKDEKV